VRRCFVRAMYLSASEVCYLGAIFVLYLYLLPLLVIVVAVPRGCKFCSSGERDAEGVKKIQIGEEVSPPNRLGGLARVVCSLSKIRGEEPRPNTNLVQSLSPET